MWRRFVATGEVPTKLRGHDEQAEEVAEADEE